ncbi:MAG: hypothetical protein GXO85_15085, partial [Chlorobi bacterium]|nr:hypothetical protein [Chlorobiota bacterium]
MKTLIIVLLLLLSTQLLSQTDKRAKTDHQNILQDRLIPDSNIFEQFTDPIETFN